MTVPTSAWLTAAKARIRLHGVPGADRRSVGAQVMLAFREQLRRRPGGDADLSPQRKKLVDLAVRVAPISTTSTPSESQEGSCAIYALPLSPPHLDSYHAFTGASARPETFLRGAWIDAAIAPGRHELPPRERIRYEAAVDLSGGGQDGFTLAIVHGGGLFKSADPGPDRPGAVEPLTASLGARSRVPPQRLSTLGPATGPQRDRGPRLAHLPVEVTPHRSGKSCANQQPAHSHSFECSTV